MTTFELRTLSGSSQRGGFWYEVLLDGRDIARDLHRADITVEAGEPARIVLEYRASETTMAVDYAEVQLDLPDLSRKLAREADPSRPGGGPERAL